MTKIFNKGEIYEPSHDWKLVVLIEQDRLATSHETLNVYFSFLSKLAQLNRALKDITCHCISKSYALSSEKALLLVYLYIKTSPDECYIHRIISNYWYWGLNPSYILNALSKQGLIEKKSHTEDKRKILVTLSSSGEILAKEVKNRIECLLDYRPGLIQSLFHSIHAIEHLMNLLP
ncbi:MarR family transcriptional regulator [Holospora undulata]|uniref:Putative transcriptional regulator, MarR family n=1 Tax=Holospora undulata HU1 TaxID=1321371 RepID=A0A061JFU1_9PROT|nr:MarR family transcriptional regulator [Holospora undulata]ETZ04596.1 putative transcriptional regulator, MarR family [Holospora undulata HU1]